MGGIHVVHMRVVLHERSADMRTNTEPIKGGVFEETNDVQHVLHKLGFAGAVVEHEWVSASIIIRQEEEILGVELNYHIDLPCVVQWKNWDKI